MLTTIVKQLDVIAHSQRYWLSSIAAGLSFLVLALVYQYTFEYDPCVMCIQIRLWVTLWILVSIIGLITLRYDILNKIAHLAVVLVAIGLVERSYQLLGTERGFVFGDCGFDLGLPAWFAIDEWLPSVFRIETSCGYTPELLFGITMAEALMLFSVALLLLSFCISLVSFLRAPISKDA